MKQTNVFNELNKLNVVGDIRRNGSDIHNKNEELYNVRERRKAFRPDATFVLPRLTLPISIHGNQSCVFSGETATVSQSVRKPEKRLLEKSNITETYLLFKLEPTNIPTEILILKYVKEI